MLSFVLFLAVAGDATCPKVLVSVCDELAAGRPLRAAELAAPLVRDATLAPSDRRAAASIAVGALLKEGSIGSRCAAWALLEEYFRDPSLPRTSALQRRREELAGLECEAPSGEAPSSPPTASVPPSVSSVSPPPAPSVPPLRAPAPRPVAQRRTAAGGVLLGLGVGFAALTGGALGVMGHQLGLARGLTERAREAERNMTPAEEAAFRGAYASAEQARWVALGVGLTSAAALAVGLPLTVSGRRLRLAPAMSREGAGLLIRGRF